jgi:uncharacterized protein YndB with AHSA1/START domain
MTDRSVVHDTFVLERSYAASPARVFAAWSDPVAKAKWFGDPDDDQGPALDMDFRVGGRESFGGAMHAGHVYSYDALYQDIVDDHRIVYTYEMTMDGKRISVSVSTVQFTPDGDGTALTFTEQGAYLDGYDTPNQREAGTRGLLESLATALGEPVHADLGWKSPS